MIPFAAPQLVWLLAMLIGGLMALCGAASEICAPSWFFVPTKKQRYYLVLTGTLLVAWVCFFIVFVVSFKTKGA